MAYEQRAVIYPVAGPGLVTGQWSCMRLCTHRSINSADWFNSPAVSPSSPIPVCHIFSSFFCFHLIDDKLIIMYIMYGYGTLIKSSEQMCEYSITEDTILSVSIRSFHAKIAGYEMMWIKIACAYSVVISTRTPGKQCGFAAISLCFPWVHSRIAADYVANINIVF